jgi:hypothetical protein
MYCNSVILYLFFGSLQKLSSKTAAYDCEILSVTHFFQDMTKSYGENQNMKVISLKRRIR